MTAGSKIKVSCERCGKAKSIFPCQAKRRKYGFFCNKLCLGKFRSAKLTGDLAANFKGIGARDRKYISVLAPWHPQKTKKGTVYLHRLIAEARLGRYLNNNEVVHHIDEDPMNNAWANLEVTTQAEHAKKHTQKRGKNGRFEIRKNRFVD